MGGTEKLARRLQTGSGGGRSLLRTRLCGKKGAINDAQAISFRGSNFRDNKPLGRTQRDVPVDQFFLTV